MNRKVLQISLILLLTLTVVGSVSSSAAAPGIELERVVIAGGGGPVSAGTFELNATIGQPLAGSVSLAAFELCAGFWCRPGQVQVYLPLVVRTP